jgi:hypothetical protein
MGAPYINDISRLRVNSVWDKEELPEEWMESITSTIYKKGDEGECSNYRGMSLSSTSYTILSNVLLSRLIPYAEKITEDHPRGFRRKRPTNDHILCIRHILEKKMGIQ